MKGINRDAKIKASYHFRYTPVICCGNFRQNIKNRNNQKSVLTPFSAFHRLLKILTQQIRCDGFEVLEDAHSVGVAENLVRLFVVAKADVGGGDEQIERIVLVHVQIPVLGFFLRRK